MRALGVLLLCLAAAQAAFVHERFDSDWAQRWIHSKDPKYAGRFAHEAPKGSSDPSLKVPEKAKHYGISTALEPVDPSEGLVLQYEVKLPGGGLTCGGAYMKFLTHGEVHDPEQLKDDTPYTVMFGPDKCGSTNKVHLILRHKSPKTGKIEEKHLKYPPAVANDELTHVYTAVLYPGNNSYAVLIDGEEKKAGSLFTDFEPAFNPPEEIDDPEDSKPADWVEEAKIPDPTATKPEDWDEDAPEMIPDEEAVKPEGWLDEEPLEIDDPEAVKPEDWDDEEDGDWEAPKVANPKCKEAPGCGEWKRPTKRNPDFKGKWKAPLIDNPDYKGPWAPRKIPNPEYYKDESPLQNIGKVGGAAIEIWTMDDGIYFDNVVVGNDGERAAEVREATWAPKHAAESKAAEEEKERKKAEAERKKAAEEKAAAASEQTKKLVSLIFDQPFLEPYAEKLAPVRAAVEANPLLLASPLLLLLPLVLSLRGKKKVDRVGAAKKADITPADDKAPAAEAKRNGAAKKEAEGEIEEESEEEEEEEKPAAGARRRVRRE